uniref:Uncharacterized protein n=1 Tax=Arundo donax TaxID=35708 RepID=A0A0A9AKD8_ARUDO
MHNTLFLLCHQIFAGFRELQSAKITVKPGGGELHNGCLRSLFEDAQTADLNGYLPSSTQLYVYLRINDSVMLHAKISGNQCRQLCSSKNT